MIIGRTWGNEAKASEIRPRYKIIKKDNKNVYEDIDTGEVITHINWERPFTIILINKEMDIE